MFLETKGWMWKHARKYDAAARQDRIAPIGIHGSVGTYLLPWGRTVSDIRHLLGFPPL